MSTQPLPLYVTTTLKFLRRQLQIRRHYTCVANTHYLCALTAASWSEAWRVDAKAEGNDLGIGGWWPSADSTGVISKAHSPWFAVELTTQSGALGLSDKTVRAFRLIATLEALGLLLALMAFGPGLGREARHQVIQLPAFTDNKGNGYTINKLMTTKFPLCAIIMEMSAQMEAIGARVEVHWTPRERNEEADALSNGTFEGFDMEKRVTVNVEQCKWLVLKELLMYGAEFQEERARIKASGRQRKGPHHKRRKRREVEGSGPVVAEIRRVSTSFGPLRGFFRDGSVLEFWGFLVKGLWFQLGGRVSGPSLLLWAQKGFSGKIFLLAAVHR